jgi:hypothetical protein
MLHAPSNVRPRGTRSATLNIFGVDVDITYDSFGRYVPETRDDPAEFPEITIISIDIEGRPVAAAHLDTWLEVLPIYDALEKHLGGYHG